jgi:hypothetical protein
MAVLSSRPDMVSGGTALFSVQDDVEGLRVTLNGRDVTNLFRPDGQGQTALLTGLKPGKNVVEVRTKKGHGTAEILNHPADAPLFSGPLQTPFVCQTVAAGLGEPLDGNCNAKPQIAHFYRSTEAMPAAVPGVRPPNAADTPPGFKPYNPNAPRPADMASTTTTDGETVDFIVRREVGVINRAIYQISFLHDPRTPMPDPWTRTKGWNGRLVYSFGGGCGAGYRQGLISGAVDVGSLGKGFATATSSLNVLGNNCNDVLSAETLLRVKEHFIKTFGAPVYTIGTGGSGGSIQQHLITQNYPGLLDGIIPAASYPDVATVVEPVSDCAILNQAMEASGQTWTDSQKTAVSGFATWGTCVSWMKSFSPRWLRPGSCDAVVPKNSGARCTLQDNLVNIYGRDPKTGYARNAYDNTGVQYGLAAFNAGTITADQFVALNERAGGFDIDGNFVAQRSVADPEALRIAYRTGRVDAASGAFHNIPVLDVRQYLDTKGDIHDRVRSFSMRARLVKANGSAANQVMLVNPRNFQPVLAMNEWLTTGKRPADLVDACWTAEGERIAEPFVYGGKGRCNELYPAHADPRLVAGAPLTNDVLKCALKAIDTKEYKQPLTAEQVARLKAVFPQGVCDYTRPGVGQENKPEPWKRF